MHPTLALKCSTRLQAEFIRELNRPPVLGEVLHRLVAETRDLLDAGACTIFLIDQDRRRATQVAGAGYQEVYTGRNDVRVVAAADVSERPLRGEELGLTGWMLSTGMPLLATSPEEVREHPHHADRLRSLDGDFRLRTFMGVPFRGVYGEVIGVIKAERRLDGTASQSVEPFSPGDQLVLETMARLATRCVTYVEIARSNPHADVATAWSRDVITEAAANENELDSFLHTAAAVAAAAMAADSCGIFLRDETGQTLTQRAGTGSQALRKMIRSYLWPDPAMIQKCKDPTECHPPKCSGWCNRPAGNRVGLTAWLAATGKSFHARNFDELSLHCHHRGAFVEIDPTDICGAFFGIPLSVGGGIIGAINVQNRTRVGASDERDFSPEAQRRFRIIAEDIALSMTRLQANIPVRYEIIERAKETIFKIFRGDLGLQELVQTVVQETRALFNAGACALFLKQGDELLQPGWAAAGWAQRGPEVRKYKLVDHIPDHPATVEEKVGLTVWIAARQQKFSARSHQELSMHPHHRGDYDLDNFFKGDRCESFMGAPLLIREGRETVLVGVLKVETKTRGVGEEKAFTYFSELDEIVFDLLASSAAVAIQNARLRESEARATETAWRQFTAMAAHRMAGETFTAGAALHALRDMLAPPPGDGATAAPLATLESSLHRIDNLVDEFTEFTKPRMHNVSAVNVNRLCREAANSRPGMRIHLRLAQELPAWWGDEEDLLYCLKEMVLNAAKELKAGGEMTIVTKSLHPGGQIRIEMIDNGRGVKPEYKERIFDPAFRDRKGGAGLGLAIVRRIVEQHSGKVWEQGVPQEGAHFVIELPVRAPEPGAFHPMPVDRHGRTREALRPAIDNRPARKPIEQPVPRPAAGAIAQILFVEDDDSNREAILPHLESGFANRRIFWARNEREAALLIEKEAFDLIITDINLSESGGSETGGIQVMELERAKGRSTPIIVVTGYGNSEIVAGDDTGAPPVLVEDRARQLGCVAFLARKSTTADVLAATVNRVLNDRCAQVSPKD